MAKGKSQQLHPAHSTAMKVCTQSADVAETVLGGRMHMCSDSGTVGSLHVCTCAAATSASADCTCAAETANASASATAQAAAVPRRRAM